MPPSEYTSLYAALTAVPDPRQARGCRYPWPVLLLLIAAALLAGETHVRGIARWLAYRADTVLPLLPGALPRLPSRATYYRALRAVDLDALNQHLAAWTAAPPPPPVPAPQTSAVAPLPPAAGEPVPLLAPAARAALPPAWAERAFSLDGKTHCGVRAHGVGCHTVSVVHHRTARVHYQQQVATKSSEQTLAPTLLAALDLHGTLLTLDALHTHQPLAAQILAQGGHYFFIVKDNQPTLAGAIAELFADPPWGTAPTTAEYSRAVTHDKGHGRRETRTLERSSALNTYARAELGWSGVAQVLRRTCVRVETKTGKRQEGVWYAITSLPAAEASVAEMEAIWREHWTIENKVHYVRDVSMGEDGGQAWTGNTPGALAALRNAVLNLLRGHGVQAIAEALAEYAASPPKIFALLRSRPLDAPAGSRPPASCRAARAGALRAA